MSIRVERAFGEVVEGEAVVSEEGFSPRYDLDRWSGVITKPGHKLEGVSLKDKICFFPTAKGGIAAGWAFLRHQMEENRAQSVHLWSDQSGDGAGRHFRGHHHNGGLDAAPPRRGCHG